MDYSITPYISVAHLCIGIRQYLTLVNSTHRIDLFARENFIHLLHLERDSTKTVFKDEHKSINKFNIDSIDLMRADEESMLIIIIIFTRK